MEVISAEVLDDFNKFEALCKEQLVNKPANWRDGQTIFNFVDEVFGVARHVQFKNNVDCFYDDRYIDEFIKKSYAAIQTYRRKTETD